MKTYIDTLNNQQKDLILHRHESTKDESIAEVIENASRGHVEEDASTNCYVEAQKLDETEVIQAVRQKEVAATSLAHPNRDLSLGRSD